LTLGMVPPEDSLSHVNEAVNVAGAKRIGHGVDIVYEKNSLELVKALRENNVTVEINLTSNRFILGVENEDHPITLYLKNDVPIVISTDDPGISRITLGSELLTLVCEYEVGYKKLKQIIYNSINCSFLSKSDKEKSSRVLDEGYIEFEKLISTSRI
jgi:adenosine deaminase